MTKPEGSVRPAIVVLGVCWLLGVSAAGAFPLDDQTGSFGPTARESLSDTDANDLRSQLRTIGGSAAPTTTGGWIILPRLNVVGLVTDNALQVSSPRQSDVASIISPGINVVADTSRLQLRFDYSPILTMYARTSSQNALSHSLNASGLLTLVPELLFVDLRAVAGVQSITGGFGGINGFGLGLPQADSLGASIANSAVLNRRNQFQTFSAGISPYLLRQFGDYGTLRIGTSFQVTTQSNVTGFGTLPLTTTGDNAQSQFTTEQTVRFVTGEFLGRIQNTVEGTLSQTPISSTTGPGGRRFGSAFSSRQIITNRTAYAINHAITVFGTLGYENIDYTGGLTQKVSGLVWDIGTTLTPNPDSSITVSYGRRDGAESVNFFGTYALSPRTSISANYASRLTTQLQNLQSQLDQSVLNTSGVLVNSQTGAPLVIGNNGLALQPGLFRFDTFTMSAQTALDRDLFTLGLISTKQSSPNGSPSTASTTARTVTGSWQRELRPDLSLNTVLSYTTQTTGGTSGVGRTFAGSIGLNYLMTETLTGRIRYSYFNRQAGAATAFNPVFGRLSFSQNLFTVSLTKQF